MNLKLETLIMYMYGPKLLRYHYSLRKNNFEAGNLKSEAETVSLIQSWQYKCIIDFDHHGDCSDGIVPSLSCLITETFVMKTQHV